MRRILSILLFFTCSYSIEKKDTYQMHSREAVPAKKYYYLALGDSYTIGEKVAATDNLPSQVVRFLKDDSLDIEPPRIIATTGWTTDELEAGIEEANSREPFRPAYDLVTLLIGVNNQYRNQLVEDYKPAFEALLKRAIRYAGGDPDHVIVLSIPDWGVTPFAMGRDRKRISREIDAFNAANKNISIQNKVHYIDITAWTRDAVNDPGLLAEDGLHPSGKEYKRWALSVAAIFKHSIK
jgi:lysophospholipase L1-like esterase